MPLVSLSGETYPLKLIKLDKNSPYTYEKIPSIEFKGRPASSMEKKAYRVQVGVDTSTDSVYIFSTTMPEEIKDGDKVIYLGKEWTVSSVGYYFDQNRIVNASIMSEDAIIKMCPKGITLQ